MKAKLRSIEGIILFIVLVLDAYLLYLNVNIVNYSKSKEIKSTANYIEITNDFKEEKEEIVENLVVFDNLTLDELSEKINKSLNSTISGKGYLIATHSLEMGVDPYMATAIILHETGCTWECSRLVTECNNVGGQVGYGCSGYSYFNSLDEGIIAFIDNLYNNYISYGLVTPEEINPKYAEDRNWSINVNKYIDKIKAQ